MVFTIVEILRVWKDILMQVGLLIKRIILLQVDECLCLGEVLFHGLVRNKLVFHIQHVFRVYCFSIS